MPIKKPKKKELTEDQKQFNRNLSSKRVQVEHAFSAVKRHKIVRNTIRLKGQQARQQAMEIACGLHNFRSSIRIVASQ